MLDFIVHITFDKITGLKGTFEGSFICYEDIDPTVPLVFKAFIQKSNRFVFNQGEKLIYLQPVETLSTLNYMEHFYYGVNFLISKISYGRGVATDSQNPN